MKTLKTVLCLMLCLSLLVFAGCGAADTAEAEGDGPVAYLSVSVAGELVMTRAAIAMEDVDGDGVVTLDELLATAAAAEGVSYASEDSTYGLAITELWGDKSGSYGYFVNNDFVNSNLSSEVKEGDEAYVYSFADPTNWSDAYSFFDVSTATVKAGETLDLSLFMVGYDETFSPVEASVAGAVITVDGEATEFTTDANGKVSITLDAAGTYTVSATAGGLTLVPPVCVITVE